MQPVIVEVESVQIDKTGKREEISFVTAGQLYKKDVGYYLRYEEEIIEAKETTTTLKIQERMVTLIRDGKVRMKQEFKPGASSSFAYQTPYGELNFELIVDKVQTKINSTNGRIKLKYDLKDKGELISHNQLIITYEEDRNG